MYRGKTNNTRNKNWPGYQMVLYNHNKKILETSTKLFAAFVTAIHFGKNLNIPLNTGILPSLSGLPTSPVFPGNPRQVLRVLINKLPARWRCWVNAPRWCLVSILLGPVPPTATERMDLVIIDRSVKVYPAPSCVRSADTDCDF